jgi:hypothetical protein
VTREDAAALGRQSRSGARQERIEILASMRLHHGYDQPPPGYLTSRQAAWRLGVSPRTVERYRAELKTAPNPPIGDQ